MGSVRSDREAFLGQGSETSVQVSHLLPLQLLPSQAWPPVSLLPQCQSRTGHLYLPQAWIRVPVPSLHVRTWRQLVHMPSYHAAFLLGTVRAL